MTFNKKNYQFLVLLNYSEQDHKSLACSCSRLSLPSRPHFLVSYSSFEQDQSKYPASLLSHVPWVPPPLSISTSQTVFYHFKTVRKL